MRDYIGDYIRIDGRMIPYRIVTATDYFQAKGFNDTEIDKYFDTGIGELVNQIIGIKQSCFLLRRVSHSCQSLSDGLFNLKNNLIHELRNEHSFEFDDEFVEEYGH
ncbi:hypothetical protein EBB07_28990 [Paenibacillaceae bacterium]|nr:hypothetical protein EBB07_28990 [Paenibacillaceae bacterium]